MEMQGLDKVFQKPLHETYARTRLLSSSGVELQSCDLQGFVKKKIKNLVSKGLNSVNEIRRVRRLRRELLNVIFLDVISVNMLRETNKTKAADEVYR